MGDCWRAGYLTEQYKISAEADLGLPRRRSSVVSYQTCNTSYPITKELRAERLQSLIRCSRGRYSRQKGGRVKQRVARLSRLVRCSGKP
jgi:hypothetical protein